MISRWNLYRQAIEAAHAAELESVRLTGELIAANDRERDLRADLDSLVISERQAKQAALECREKVADWIASQAGLKPVFGNPFEPRPEPPSEPIRSGRVHARDLVSDMEREFFEAERRMADSMLNNG